MKKLLSVVAIGVCISVSGIYADEAKQPVKTEVTKQQSGTVINLAGKQRMLTQKMSKEALFIAKGINVEKNKENLKKTSELFDKTLKGLIDGDKDLNLLKTENKEILAQLNKVKELWNSFKANIDKVIDGKADKATLDAIAKDNIPLLKEMNSAVGMYAKASGSKLDPKMADTINRAGKQRMLTQKMTKELLLIANGIDVDKNRESLKKTAELFENTLKDLTANCKKDDIKKQLGVVEGIWKEYKPTIDKADTSDEALKKAEELNMKLLKEMNSAVKMYEASIK
jgi:GTP cyclohydrolase I